MATFRSADTGALYGLAREFDGSREQLALSRQHGIPSLAEVSGQLTNLSALVTLLTDEVLFRVTAPSRPTAQQRRVVEVFTEATVPASQALQHLSAAYRQLGFLHRFADRPANPDLADVREHAIAVVNDELDEVQAALLETPHLLHTGADRLGDLPPRTAAARSRTTIPDAPAVARRDRAAEPKLLIDTPGPAQHTAVRHGH
jgi:hypothetical protein